jgi:polyhydroxyalkanoate synthase subunit PhaC
MTESPWQVAASAANVLAPESGLLASPDVAEFGEALTNTARAVAAKPAHIAVAATRLVSDLVQIAPTTITHWFGDRKTTPSGLNPKDRRFSDPAWLSNPAFVAVRLYYAAWTRFAHQLIEDAGVDSMSENKARLAADLILDTLAPTNFLPTNPTAIKRAFDTGGTSLVRGARNFVDDVINNKGRPRQVDTSPFVFGENMAATPGKVIYRNDLMELIQYAPQTEQVHAAPLLCSPPWINKYYVMDLAPKRSFIEWAVQHNRTVFAISYRNPTAAMSDVTLDD